MSTDTQAEAQTFVSPKDLANAWGTDPKSVRRFLRGLTTNRAGKGGRWEISTADIEALTEAWNNKAETKRFQLEAPEVTDEVDDTEDIDDLVELEDIDDEV